jgi:hypothetical protein
MTPYMILVFILLKVISCSESNADQSMKPLQNEMNFKELKKNLTQYFYNDKNYEALKLLNEYGNV